MKRRDFFQRMGLGAISVSLNNYKMAFYNRKSGFGNSDAIIQFDKGAIISLKYKNDVYNTDYILKDHRMGDIIIQYRFGKDDWLKLYTADLAKAGQFSIHDNDSDSGLYKAEFYNDDLIVFLHYELENKSLKWNFSIKNKTSRSIEIGDISIPFPMNSDWSWDKKVTYEERVIRHSFISGHNSFIFWTRCNAIGPYLLMTPTGSTHLEYYDQPTINLKKESIFTAYIYSLAQKEYLQKIGSAWRQENTGTILKPNGIYDAGWEGGFCFQWAKNYGDIQRIISDNGLINVYISPGMTIPKGLKVQLALQGFQKIKKIIPEFSNQTKLSRMNSKGSDTTIFYIEFKCLGENKLTIHYGDNKNFTLEFFVTEPIQTLLNKRSQFLKNRLQIIDKTKWYNGVLSDWNMKDHILISPDNLYTITEGRRYMVTCDDPGLARPAFLASKNVEYPIQEEVDALEYYIQNFVWGGLQMTESEAYPYAIYGIPDWKRNRDSDDLGSKGQSHIWRIYDYPHVILMYLSMYRIARFHPGIKMQLSWEIYLERSYRTAIAFYTYPLEVVNWSPYQTGNYNEISIVELIEEMEETGWKLQAFQLRKYWEEKVAYFLSGKANMFGSEYPYDTTGFESTQVIARYALIHPDFRKNKETPLDIGVKDAELFMQKQIELNVGCRGWIEKAYYLYGSDYRGGGNAKYTLSYMSQMGGWAILDYVLYFAADPFQYLQLAYASILSSWALLNSGNSESNYGYWFPGEINDGGAGGGFEPLAYGSTWLGQKQKRGSWYYGCEIDLGYCGFLRAACTILADDPVFGLTVFGGTFKRIKDSILVFPNDGVRRRFHILKEKYRFHIEIRYDRFAENIPISISPNLDSICFDLENVDNLPHEATLLLSGLPEAKYQILIDGINALTFEGNNGIVHNLKLAVSMPIHKIELKNISRQTSKESMEK